MSEIREKEIKFLVIMLLIGVLLAGCGVQVSSGPEEEQVPPGQAKQTEVGEVENESEEPGEEEILLPSETPLPEIEELTPTFTVAPAEKVDVGEATPVVITGGEKEDMIAKCKADLASRLGISQDAITVVRAEAVTWNNSSLGCPIEGMMYSQVLTPGYQIILMANGGEYDYRTNEGSYKKICRQ